MQVYKIDENNDWLFGKMQIARSKDAVLQNTKTRIQSFKNDWYLGLKDGLDWFSLLGYGKQKSLEKAVFSVVRQTEGVKKIVSFDREKMQIEIETIFASAKDTINIKI